MTLSFHCNNKPHTFLANLRSSEAPPHLADPDSRGRSGEAGLAGLELTGGAEVSLTEAVDSCHSEPVRLTRKQLAPLPALIVLRPRRPPAGRGLMGNDRRREQENEEAERRHALCSPLCCLGFCCCPSSGRSQRAERSG